MGGNEEEEYVYRISTAAEWEELKKNGRSYGSELDKSTGCIHFSKLDQVRTTLENFFMNIQEELYLLQIDAKKLGDGLVYEESGSHRFPHLYGPSRTFVPLPLDAVANAEKITRHLASPNHPEFSCTLLN